MSNQHDQNVQDQLAAYALGALDANEVLQVEAHLRSAEASRAELKELQAVVALLPYASQPVEPPAAVRRQLFARIAASHTPESETWPPALKPQPQQAARGWRWAMPILAAVLVLMVLGLGGMLFSLQATIDQLAQEKQMLAGNLSVLQSELAQTSQQLAATQAEQQQLAANLETSQTELQAIARQLSQEEQAFTFVTAPGVATRQLTATEADIQAGGAMYMRPGHSEAVVLFQGLTPLPEGEVYVFWLADGDQQVAAGTVTVDADGLGRLVVQAPRAVNFFEQVMLTVEPTPEVQQPGDKVLLEGSL